MRASSIGLVLVCCLLASPAKSTLLGLPDQEHIASSLHITVTGGALAQTFLVGISGLLTGVELPIYRASSGAMTSVIEILGTDRGFPVRNEILATAILTLPNAPPNSSMPTMIEIDLSAAGLIVTDGELLAIAVSGYPCCSSVGWGGGSRQQATANYFPGAGFDISGDEPRELTAQFGIDFQFRTYVQPIPEPSTALLLGLGLAGLGVRIRVRNSTG